MPNTKTISFTYNEEVYTVPVHFKADASLADQLKAVTNAANEAYNDYCYTHKLGRYGD